MHVRFDSTSLALIADYILRGKQIIADLKERIITVPKPKKPISRQKSASVEAWKAARAVYTETLKTHNSQVEEFNRQVSEIEERAGASTYEMRKEKPENPMTKLNRELPAIFLERPEGIDDNAWKLLKKAQWEKRDERIKERQKVKDSDDFKDQVKKYENYESEIQEHGLKLFRPLNDMNPKHGWKPSASVSTDGVAAEFIYERIVSKPIKTCEAAEKGFKDSLKKKKDEKEARNELDPYDDYDPYENTCVGDALIAGLDPGRVKIATMIVIDHNGKRHKFQLSRGRYHTESGILSLNKAQHKRLKCLEASFASLAEGGGALRASTSSEIATYIRAAKVFEDEWWSLQLKRREQRASFQRYMGKQKTLAKFFSDTRKSIDLLRGPKQTRLEVAYGSAGETMAPTGRGELAVPTKGVFGYCLRAFTNLYESDKRSGNVVSYECEDNTSKICYETKRQYEKVYKDYVFSDFAAAVEGEVRGVEYLQHTNSRKLPVVPPDKVVAFNALRQAIKEKNKRRRGGNTIVPPTAALSVGELAVLAEEKTRFIESRGLLFCPERRMFYDRDGASARAIAGLRCIKLRGLGRPTVFRSNRS
jgi:hypothetical protein